MKVCVAQLKPIDGDMPRNIAAHERLIRLAISQSAQIIVFPELSLTGYHRKLARELAVDLDDRRFDVFQSLSDEGQCIIGIGVPTRGTQGVRISQLLFQPHQARSLYSKMHLHASEETHFVPGPASTGLIGSDPVGAWAICYELSVPEHAAHASRNGAGLYLASVAADRVSIAKHLRRLSEVAHEYSMAVCMANCIGRTTDWDWAGRSAVWNNRGEVLDQLDDAQEGIIVYDTQTQVVWQQTLDPRCVL